MFKKFKRHIETAGLPPGTLISPTDRTIDKTKIDIINYSKDKCDVHTDVSLHEYANYISENHVTWINIVGLDDVDVVRQIGTDFSLHQLFQEDILNTALNPNIEEQDNYLFMIFKVLKKNTEDLITYNTKQISFIIIKGCLVTFSEIGIEDILNLITKGVKNNRANVRKNGSDFLAYTIIDLIVDKYFEELEAIGDRIEKLEEGLKLSHSLEQINEIHHLKKELIFLQNLIWALRNICYKLERNKYFFIKKATSVYFKDVYDHLTQITDYVQAMRNISSEIHDLVQTMINNHTNNIMRILTIITTIFIPLSFIAGFYGMNFKFMPELNYQESYYIVIFVMLIIALLMLVFFWKKRWIGKYR